MNILLFLTLILLIILFTYTMFIETFQNYNQNYEFVPISEFNSENDTKFINQFDNILDLDISEYKNLKEKIAFKKKHTINNPNVSKRNLELINNLDKRTNYPQIKRELSLIEFDDVLTRLKQNKLYTYKKSLNNLIPMLKYDQRILHSYYLVKEWIIEKISVLADEPLYEMKYVNNERFKYIEDKLLTYNINYKEHLEQFIFKMRVYRPNKQTHFIVHFDILLDNYNIKYYINDLIILGTDIESNILFSKFNKNNFGLSDKFSNKTTKSDLNKFLEEKKKKEIYEYDRHYCFYKNAKNKNECISVSKNDNTIGIYDSPCLYDEDCPFYKKNNNYPNKRGGCKKGYCEMPVNINLLGYKEYLDSNKALCYNCKKDNCSGIECNMCCEEQKDSEKYPNLNGPDYAYPNDFNERIKYSNYFENNNLTPIKLIA
jgi:hypothetical protein